MYVITGVSTVFIWGRKIEEAIKKIKKGRRIWIGNKDAEKVHCDRRKHEMKFAGQERGKTGENVK